MSVGLRPSAAAKRLKMKFQVCVLLPGARSDEGRIIGMDVVTRLIYFGLV